MYSYVAAKTFDVVAQEIVPNYLRNVWVHPVRLKIIQRVNELLEKSMYHLRVKII